MKKYLMGIYSDTLEDGMYPISFVDEIKKEDLLRAKNYDVMIVDLIEGKLFDSEENKWILIEGFTQYKDQWK